MRLRNFLLTIILLATCICAWIFLESWGQKLGGSFVCSMALFCAYKATLHSSRVVRFDKIPASLIVIFIGICFAGIGTMGIFQKGFMTSREILGAILGVSIVLISLITTFSEEYRYKMPMK